MERKRILSFLVGLFAVVTASAQFYTTGEDPGGLRWYSISSKNYRIIYPEGLDSLAGVYGNLLESFLVCLCYTHLRRELYSGNIAS